MLIVRVDFSDLPGDPTSGAITDTKAYVQNIADNQVRSHYVRNSYNLPLWPQGAIKCAG